MVKFRRLNKQDISQMAKLANNDKIWQKLTDRFPRNYTEKDADDFLNMIKDENPHQTFAIKYDGEFCGMIET